MKIFKTSTTLVILGLVSLLTMNRAHATDNPDCGCNGGAIKNGNFENNLDNWTKVGSKAKFKTEAIYKVCGNAQGLIDAREGAGSIYQDALVVAGSQLSFFYYGGTHNTSETHQFRLTYYNSDNVKIETNQNIVSGMNHDVGNTTTLKKYSFTSKAPVRAYKVRIEFYASGDYFKLDVACLTVIPPDYCTDCTANKLLNPSFEDGTSNWQVQGSLVNETPFKVCGETAGVLHGSGKFWQDVAINPESDVVLKIWGAYHEPSNQKFELVFLDVQSKELTDGKVKADVKKAVSASPWGLAKYTLTTKAPSNARYVRVSGSASGNFLKVDAACLTVTGGTPLPVTLAEFKVAKEQGSVNVLWTTVSETNAREFEVQHSADGKQWANLATIEAKGESSSLIYYSYVHDNPLNGNNLYRLKMIDADDTFAFSRIVNLNFEGEQITVFPNPTTDKVRFGTNGESIRNVQLYTMNGSMVLDTVPDSANEINLAKLSQGKYVIRINKTNGTATSRNIQILR